VAFGDISGGGTGGQPPRVRRRVYRYPQLTILVTADARDEPALELAGDLDVASREHLWQLIGSLLANCNPRTVTLDLSRVEFVDCSGLTVLLRAHRQLAARGGRLISTGAQPAVRRIIQLTGLDGYLDLGEELAAPRLASGDETGSQFARPAPAARFRVADPLESVMLGAVDCHRRPSQN
jgi:anti-anti-sigma factor